MPYMFYILFFGLFVWLVGWLHLFLVLVLLLFSIVVEIISHYVGVLKHDSYTQNFWRSFNVSLFFAFSSYILVV